MRADWSCAWKRRLCVLLSSLTGAWFRQAIICHVDLFPYNNSSCPGALKGRTSLRARCHVSPLALRRVQRIVRMPAGHSNDPLNHNQSSQSVPYAEVFHASRCRVQIAALPVFSSLFFGCSCVYKPSMSTYNAFLFLLPFLSHLLTLQPLLNLCSQLNIRHQFSDLRLCTPCEV